MGYLLDTHILLWAAQDSPKLSAPCRVLLEAGKEQVYFSVANIWEIVIKSGLRRGDFLVDAERLRSEALFAGYDELPSAVRMYLPSTTFPVCTPTHSIGSFSPKPPSSSCNC